MSYHWTARQPSGVSAWVYVLVIGGIIVSGLVCVWCAETLRDKTNKQHWDEDRERRNQAIKAEAEVGVLL